MFRPMHRTVWMLAIAGLLAAWAPVFAEGSGTGAAGTPPGSIARQLQLLNKLNAAMHGTTLAAALNHNREVWEGLSPDERQKLRKLALAWHAKSRPDQEEMVERFDEWLKIRAEKQQKYRRMNEWLQKVVASFPPDQRERLKKMTAEQRGRMIRRRRDELIKAGKLTPGASQAAPTTQPAAAAPTTQPAE